MYTFKLWLWWMVYDVGGEATIVTTLFDVPQYFAFHSNGLDIVWCIELWIENEGMESEWNG